MITGKIDILLLSETKIDDPFPSTQFNMSGFSTPYRLDHSAKGGWTLLYIRDDIPSKILKSYMIPNDIE